MINHLTVGPVRFLLNGDEGIPVRYDDWAYGGFFADREVKGAYRPLAELPVQLVRGSRQMPATSPWFSAGRNWAVWQDGDDWLFCTGFSGRERPRVTCRLLGGLDRATLSVDGDPADAPLRYPLDQVLTWGLLGRCGGVLLHAATVVCGGLGLVFAGRSGAGKTTLSALCHQAGWRVLNDDRVVLFRRDGRLHVAGTPWHGSGRFAEADEVPLAGIFLLSQAPFESLERLPPGDAWQSLLPMAGIPWFASAWADASLEALNDISRSVPVNRFHFRPLPSSVSALETWRKEQA
jgi:hypothetical protein